MKKFILILFIVPLLAFQSDKMVKTKLTEEIRCVLPVNFFPMSEGDILRRLPSVRKPLAAYTDESRLVDFSVNVSASKWRNSDITIAKDFFKSSIFHLYDEVTLINEEIKTINKREYAVFEFVSLVKGDGLTKKAVRKYSYIQYTIKGGQVYVYALNAPSRLKDKWKSNASTIMNSIKM